MFETVVFGAIAVVVAVVAVVAVVVVAAVAAAVEHKMCCYNWFDVCCLL